MVEINKGDLHKIPSDLKKAIFASSVAKKAWEEITPLARNEWICWTISVKTLKTRKEHIERAVCELKDGKRRPCCWIGCTHRKDKKLSPSQRFILRRKGLCLDKPLRLGQRSFLHRRKNQL